MRRPRRLTGCRRRLEPPLHRVEVLLDHLERVVVVALRAEDVAQSLEVGVRKLAIAGLGAFGLDESLSFEEANLGDADVWKIRTKVRQHFPDAHPPSAAQGSRG